MNKYQELLTELKADLTYFLDSMSEIKVGSLVEDSSLAVELLMYTSVIVYLLQCSLPMVDGVKETLDKGVRK